MFVSFQVAIADHDGVLTCFGMKKGEAVVRSSGPDLPVPHRYLTSVGSYCPEFHFLKPRYVTLFFSLCSKHFLGRKYPEWTLEEPWERRRRRYLFAPVLRSEDSRRRANSSSPLKPTSLKALMPCRNYFSVLCVVDINCLVKQLITF